jgi:hypothetical protein
LVKGPLGINTASNFGDQTWSGYVCSGEVGAVWGSFNIPSFTLQGNTGIGGCSIWVGINGYLTSEEEIGTGPLQAGVSINILDGGSPVYQAWYEWNMEDVPSSETPVPSLTVNEGDEISVFIYYLTSDGAFNTIPGLSGNIQMSNLNTLEQIAVAIPAPAPATLTAGQYLEPQGDTLEWVMEAGNFGNYSGSITLPPPIFTPVTFQNVGGCINPPSPNAFGGPPDLNTATPVTMNLNGTNYVQPSLGNTPDTIVLTYVGPQNFT